MGSVDITSTATTPRTASPTQRIGRVNCGTVDEHADLVDDVSSRPHVRRLSSLWIRRPCFIEPRCSTERGGRESP